VAEHGGRSAATPKAAAEAPTSSSRVLAMMMNLRSVTLGTNGAVAGMKKGAIYIDNTTASATVGA